MREWDIVLRAIRHEVPLQPEHRVPLHWRGRHPNQASHHQSPVRARRRTSTVRGSSWDDGIVRTADSKLLQCRPRRPEDELLLRESPDLKQILCPLHQIHEFGPLLAFPGNCLVHVGSGGNPPISSATVALGLGPTGGIHPCLDRDSTISTFGVRHPIPWMLLACPGSYTSNRVCSHGPTVPWGLVVSICGSLSGSCSLSDVLHHRQSPF